MTQDDEIATSRSAEREPRCKHGQSQTASGACNDPMCPAHGVRPAAAAANAAYRCGMCGNAPCTCGSGPVYHVMVPRWRLEKLEREHARYRAALEYVVSRNDFTFAECSEAESIIERCRAALVPDQGGAG